MTRPSPRKRRYLRQLEDLPGLFDMVDIDMNVGKNSGSAPAVPGGEAAAEVAAGNAAETAIGDVDPGVLRRHEAIRFISFGSGSSGNCAYLGNSSGGILIDAGVDKDQVLKGLADNNIDPASIAGIIVTHDHSDHIHFAYTLLRANRTWALFCTPRCLQGLLRRHSISRRISDYHKAIYKEFEFQAGGFAITPFETSHDGSDNVGFSIRRGDRTFVIGTDMGVITERAAHYMSRANYLMLEADYDTDMLRTGRYPEYLKARIAGDRGHLSNADAAAFLVQTLTGAGNDAATEAGATVEATEGAANASAVAEGAANASAAAAPESVLSHVFLCHLSKDNNTPALAVATIGKAIRDAGITVGDAGGSPEAKAARLQLCALPRFDASPLYILR